eukprot:scaffold107549_cov66-Phaeocystis_antarctica.AAC.2
MSRELPFATVTPAQIVMGVITNLLPPPTLPNAKEWPEALRELMERCWQHEPSSRPSFSVILDTVERIAKDEGVLVTLTRRSRTPRPPRSAESAHAPEIISITAAPIGASWYLCLKNYCHLPWMRRGRGCRAGVGSFCTPWPLEPAPLADGAMAPNADADKRLPPEPSSCGELERWSKQRLGPGDGTGCPGDISTGASRALCR